MAVTGIYADDIVAVSATSQRAVSYTHLIIPMDFHLYNKTLANAGKMRNQGIEIAVNAKMYLLQ